ncbi:MAG TPA: T9SS type A sorting domain-containing protein [Candidatus Acidoferrales bacterium]|nr:T9SS type A sorting domain-containing protein [Candidatus Acidoferrales bacterium]
MSKLLVIALLPFFAAGAAFSQATLPDTLAGYVKGKTAPNHTYVVNDSLYVNVGDTLTISPGDTLLMKNNPSTGAACWIDVLGTFICEGTSTNRIVITTAFVDSAKHPGMWGGIIGDSCKYISVRFAIITWAGGNDASGHAYRTFDISSDAANTTNTVFTDNVVVGTVDDCIGLHGGNASVLRNTLKWVGAPDGDNINVKSGTIGEIAYNVIWGAGGNGIKINASTTVARITNVCIHNNTIAAGGWRRIDELGYGILVDASARAQIYNNIIGDMYGGLEITTIADTLRTVHDNNLFFYSVDSLSGTARYYPSDGVGRPAPDDIFDVKASNLFVSYQPFFTNDWNTLDGSNNYHLLGSSPAIGHGFTPPAPTSSNHWWNPYFVNGTDTLTLPGDANIGAYGLLTAIENQNSNVPSSFILDQNYPNPFNPSTQISYSIPRNVYVSLKVYNVLGQEVSTLFAGEQTVGQHSATFDGSNFASGVYFYRLEAGANSITKKMILVK